VVGKAVMEASGGYERVWAKALREAGLEVRIVDPKRVRSFAESAGRLARNDKIDAEMIAWFAETFSEAPSQIDDPAHDEIKALAKGRKSLIDVRSRLEMQKEDEAPPLVRKARARLLKKLAGKIAAIGPTHGTSISRRAS
jgi:transposase